MELIKITENNGQKIVSARELHNFLEVKERFMSWFYRQCQYGFIENVDYVGCKVFNTLANQELQDYALIIDTAKEISMIQRTEKGKQARQYSIECEKKLQNTHAIPQTYAEALKLAYEQAEKIEQQNRLLNKQQHYVNFVEQCFDENKEDLIALRESCKLLGLPYGHHTFIKVLSFYGVIYKNKKGDWIPKQNYIDRGYFVLKQTKQKLKDFSVINSVTLVTQKGLAYLTARKKRLMNKEAIEVAKKIK